MASLEKVEKLIAKGKEASLIKLSRNKDKEIKLAAIKGMGQVGKDDSFNLLITMLIDPDADVRAAAAEGLGTMRNGHASAHLRYHMEHESDPAVITAMKSAMAKLKEEI